MKTVDIRHIVTALGALVFLFPLSPAVAAAEQAPSVEVTFTKWMTANADGTFGPHMAGVVGGPFGTGTFSGEVLEEHFSATFVIARLEAIYHLKVGPYELSALIQGGANYTTGLGKLEGVILAGTGTGLPVRVQFQARPCTEAPDGTCFDGTFRVSLTPE